MDKKNALKVLIEHSFILTEKEKKVLLDKINNFSEEETTQIGTFLALTKKISLENGEDIKSYDQFIKYLDKLVQEPDAKKD